MKLNFNACLLGLLFPLLLQGQEIGLLRINPENMESRTQAAVWGGIEDGGFRPAYEAPFLWKAGADAQIVRHGDQSSWTGAISFEQKTGKNMTSSLLLEPDYYPIDLLEFSKGTKSRQTCRVEGGFMTDLGYEWAAGAKASFQAAHAGKQEEVRHSSFGMDAQLEPALTFVMDDDMGFITSYLLRLRTENIKATADNPQALFLDQGLRYGTYLNPGGNSSFQVREFTHGFHEQFHSPDFSLGLSILWKRGQVGENDNRYRFPGSTLDFFFEQPLLTERADHLYRISYHRQRDQLRAVAGDGGLTSLSDRIGRSVHFKYEVRFLEGVLRTLALDLDGEQWSERSLQVVPQDYTRRYGMSAAFLSTLSYGPFDLDINLMTGKGFWRGRGQIDQTEKEGDPLRLKDDWLRKTDYILAPRMGMGGALTYRLQSIDGLFVRLDVLWHHAFEVSYLPGKNREIVTLKVGYNF
jgi:hypothetical protein